MIKMKEREREKMSYNRRIIDPLRRRDACGFNSQMQKIGVRNVPSFGGIAGTFFIRGIFAIG